MFNIYKKKPMEFSINKNSTLPVLKLELIQDGRNDFQKFHDKVQNAPAERILEMANENDDADTADVILQSVFFGEVIYG